MVKSTQSYNIFLVSNRKLTIDITPAHIRLQCVN